MGKFIKFSILLFLLQNYTFTQDGWFWQNPLPQGNDLNDCSFINSQTGWFAGSIGTLIKTTDGGQTFQVKQINPQHNYINISFINSNTGYLFSRQTIQNGNIDNGYIVLKTTDGGLNWFTIKTNTNYLKLLSGVFINSNEGCFLVGHSISYATFFKTTNGGISWDSTMFQGGFLTIFRYDENNIWIAGYGKLIKSSDKGITWNHIPTSFNPTRIYFINQYTGYGTEVYAGSLMKTTNGGLNWKNLYINYNTGSFSDIIFINNNTGLAVGRMRTIIRTTNAGLNWAIIRTDATPPSSIDYGNNFNRIYNVFGTGFIIGTSGEMHKSTSTSFGENWDDISKHTSINLYGLHFININTGFVSGAHINWNRGNYVLKTTNAGMNWYKPFNNPDTASKDVYFINENTGWIGGGLHLYKTTNAGLNWTIIISGQNQYRSSMLNPFFLNSETGFVIEQFLAHSGIASATLLKTTNSGNNWFGVLTSRTFPKIKFTSLNDGWCVTVGGPPQMATYGLTRTSNSGLNWTEVEKPSPSRTIFAFENSDYNNAWCTNSEGDTLFRTTDGGSNWTAIPREYRVKLIRFINVNTGFILTEKDFQKTTNRGTTWQKVLITSFDTYRINDAYFMNENTGWLMGRNGIILKTTNGGFLNISGNGNFNLPISFTLHQNYPNPFNPITKIKYELPKDVNVTITVYDILGREVVRLVNNEYKKAGIYETEWNAVNFASGVYFYRIEAGSYVNSKKMVLLR